VALEFTDATDASSISHNYQLPNTKDAKAKLTVVEAESPSRLSKAYRLMPNGDLERLPGGNFVRGTCQVMAIENLSGLAEILPGLNCSNALIFGVPVNAAAEKILTRKAFERAGRPEDAATRTKDAFRYPEGSGILMLDYDPPKDGMAPLDRDGLVAAVRVAVPGLAQCEMLWYPSASSCIYNGDEALRGGERSTALHHAGPS
jgi:hypothetical protein